MNKPYVKEYDKEGNVTNDYGRMYLHLEPNRAERRRYKKIIRKLNKIKPQE